MAEPTPSRKRSARRASPDEDVRELQLALKRAGFDPGAADGVPGPSTTQAVRNFQKAHRLPANGIADPKTREVLESLAQPEPKAEPREPESGDVGASKRARPTVALINRSSDAAAVRRLTELLFERVDAAPPMDADGILVFVSRASIELPLDDDSDVRPLLERARAGETRLIPVVLEPVEWSHSPFFEFQAVMGARPLSEFDDLEPVVDGIVAALGRASPTPAVGRRSYLPGFAADDMHGEDLLDRRARVDFLASVLAAKQLETPLAIGLFGDWGSGKSFFMRRLQEQVVVLSEASAEARKRGAASYYCSHVRQVSFNAWLYSDSDIWPSFAANVFRSVSGIETDAPHGKTQTSDLERYQKRVADDFRGLQDERATAEMDAAALDARIDALTKEIADRQTKLKERPELGDEAGAVARSVDDVRDITGRLLRIGPAWRELGGRDLALVAAPLAVAVAFALMAVVRPGWATVSSAVLLALTGVIALLAKAVRHVDETTRLQGEVKELEAAREQLRRERDERARTQGRADEGLEAALVLPLLPRFAEEQAMRWLGREQLGAVTEMRLAFERLSKLIDESRKARESGAGSPEEHLPIDRVIVYVDDLDRCQHNVVVRVLETLQLLLSLPNFVVVVGVDSRWLFRSLQVHFKELLSSEDGAAADASWAATPQNYLEKIFQYSVVLRPIGDTGFGRLIERLLAGAGPTAPTAPALEAAAGAEQQARAGGDGAPPDADQSVQQQGEQTAAVPTVAEPAVDLTPADLVITPQELTFMKSLAPIFETPRAAKRLANLYRLLRVSVGAEELTATEGYEPVLLLLAIGIGYPGLAGDVFEAIEQSRELPWPDFCSQLRPRQPAPAGALGGAAPADRFENLVKDELTPVEVAVWTKFALAVARVSPEAVADRQLASFVDWIPVVAEFSFHPWQERLPAETHG